jgi:hypothetical protein
MAEIILGSFFIILAILPGTKFYEGRLGTRQILPPVEPAWVLRLFFFGVGLGVIIEGVRTVFRH